MSEPQPISELDMYEVDTLKTLIAERKLDFEKKKMFFVTNLEKISQRVEKKRFNHFEYASKVFGLAQMRNKTKSDLKKAKESQVGLNRTYHDLVTQLALSEAELEFRLYCGQTTNEFGAEIMLQKERDLHFKRLELQDALDTYRDSRQEIKSTQHTVSHESDAARRSAINTTTLLKTCMSVITSEVKAPMLTRDREYQDELCTALGYMTEKILRARDDVSVYINQKLFDIKKKEELAKKERKQVKKLEDKVKQAYGHPDVSDFLALDRMMELGSGSNVPKGIVPGTTNLALLQHHTRMQSQGITAGKGGAVIAQAVHVPRVRRSMIAGLAKGDHGNSVTLASGPASPSPRSFRASMIVDSGNVHHNRSSRHSIRGGGVAFGRRDTGGAATGADSAREGGGLLQAPLQAHPHHHHPRLAVRKQSSVGLSGGRASFRGQGLDQDWVRRSMATMSGDSHAHVSHIAVSLNTAGSTVSASSSDFGNESSHRLAPLGLKPFSASLDGSSLIDDLGSIGTGTAGATGQRSRVSFYSVSKTTTKVMKVLRRMSQHQSALAEASTVVGGVLEEQERAQPGFRSAESRSRAIASRRSQASSSASAATTQATSPEPKKKVGHEGDKLHGASNMTEEEQKSYVDRVVLFMLDLCELQGDLARLAALKQALQKHVLQWSSFLMLACDDLERLGDLNLTAAAAEVKAKSVPLCGNLPRLQPQMQPIALATAATASATLHTWSGVGDAEALHSLRHDLAKQRASGNKGVDTAAAAPLGGPRLKRPKDGAADLTYNLKLCEESRHLERSLDRHLKSIRRRALAAPIVPQNDGVTVGSLHEGSPSVKQQQQKQQARRGSTLEEEEEGEVDSDDEDDDDAFGSFSVDQPFAKKAPQFFGGKPGGGGSGGSGSGSGSGSTEVSSAVDGGLSGISGLSVSALATGCDFFAELEQILGSNGHLFQHQYFSDKYSSFGGSAGGEGGIEDGILALALARLCSQTDKLQAMAMAAAAAAADAEEGGIGSGAAASSSRDSTGKQRRLSISTFTAL